MKKTYEVPVNYERMAKNWDDKLPKLSKALRSESLHKKIAKAKSKPPTREMKIIATFVLNPDKTFSCSEITKMIIEKDKLTGSVAHYLSGSVSSILAKLVKGTLLKYAEEKTVRGGYLYQYNPEEQE